MAKRTVSINTLALSSFSFLAVGIVAGFLAANFLNRNEQSAGQQTTNTQAIQPGVQPGMMQDVTKVIEAARANPNDFKAQIEAGSMYAQIQRADKAIEFFDTAARIKGLTFEQNVTLANALFDIREFEKARPLYEAALAQQPNDVNVRADLGATYSDSNKPDYPSAIREFETALATNPKHEPTLFNLGAVYLKMGDETKAKEVLERLEQAAPGNELAARLRKVMADR